MLSAHRLEKLLDVREGLLRGEQYAAHHVGSLFLSLRSSRAKDLLQTREVPMPRGLWLRRQRLAGTEAELGLREGGAS